MLNICKEENVNQYKDVIERYYDNIDWLSLSVSDSISTNFIRLCKEDIIWDILCTHKTFTISELYEFRNYVSWHIYSAYGNLSQYQIRNFANDVFWEKILQRVEKGEIVLDESFLIEMQLKGYF